MPGGGEGALAWRKLAQSCLRRAGPFSRWQRLEDTNLPGNDGPTVAATVPAQADRRKVPLPGSLAIPTQDSTQESSKSLAGAIAFDAWATVALPAARHGHG